MLRQLYTSDTSVRNLEEESSIGLSQLFLFARRNLGKWCRTALSVMSYNICI
jgi:hypothetical protein